MTTLEQYLAKPPHRRGQSPEEALDRAENALFSVSEFHALDPYWPGECGTCSEHGDTNWPCEELQGIYRALGIDGEDNA